MEGGKCGTHVSVNSLALEMHNEVSVLGKCCILSFVGVVKYGA